MSIYRKEKFTADDFISSTDNIISDCAKTIARDMDNFYYQALRPYGVTRFNLDDFKGRLEMVCVNASKLGTAQLTQVFLDGEHIIDISDVIHVDEIKQYDGSTDIKYRIEKEVIWSKEVE